jgi:hypothetical protein
MQKMVRQDDASAMNRWLRPAGTLFNVSHQTIPLVQPKLGLTNLALHVVVGARVPLRGKNARTGSSRPKSESTMKTIWWT